MFGPQNTGLRAAWLLSGLLAFATVIARAIPQTVDSVVGGRIAELRSEVERHDELYFKKGQPEISDAEYDRLKRELQLLEGTRSEPHPGDSGIGDDRTGRFPTFEHRERMLSLDKAYSEDEWRSFHAKLVRQLGRSDVVFTVEPKYDGLAISLTYERGVLVRAVTRGNGAEGDDVTANVRTIRDLPLELRAGNLPIPRTVELRGEVYVDHAEFERINAEQGESGDVPYAHPRNLAAGALRSSDPDEVAQRRLSIVIYGWGAWDGASAPQSQVGFHAQVRAWGLPGVKGLRISRTADEVWSAVGAIGAERAKLGFPIDGAVVKLDDTVLRAKVGSGDQAPRWALACKYEPERAVTRLRSITLQVGRTGLLTPVAEFDPVELGGSVIRRATLHNQSEIARRDLRIGDLIEVEKAGEIIPAIVGVRLAQRPADAQPFLFPDRCPACATRVVTKRDEIAVRCSNAHCPEQRQRRLEHFASAHAVNLTGFGPATIEALIKADLLKSPSGFYRLRREDLLRMEGIGEKTADRLMDAVNRSREVELWRFINGLSIPQVGQATSRKLAALSGDITGFAHLREDQLRSAVGPSVTVSLVSFLAHSENQAEIEALITAGVRPIPPFVAAATRDLRGKVFVFTGALPALTRAQAAERVLAAGGIVRDSVSGQTDYVVEGDGAGAKLIEAEKQGAHVIDAAEFKRMIGLE
jgi:DNA ligase (NAD+)